MRKVIQDSKVFGLYIRGYNGFYYNGVLSINYINGDVFSKYEGYSIELSFDFKRIYISQYNDGVLLHEFRECNKLGVYYILYKL